MGQLVLQPTQDANNYDNLLYSGAPTTNYQNFQPMQCGWDSPTVEDTAVYKFDLSDIPAGVTITSVTLDLYVTLADQGGPTTNLQVRRILSGNSDWVLGESSWNNRKSGTAWAGSAGCHTTGTDISSTIMGQSSSWATDTWETLTLDVTEFTAMWNNNYGFWLGTFDSAPGTGAAEVFTSNMNSASNKPKLTIDYTTGGGGPDWPVMKGGKFWGPRYSS